MSSGDDIWHNLDQLIDRDPELVIQIIPVVAMRHALRVLPMLAWNGHVSFWRKENDDNRVKYLAAFISVAEILHGLRNGDGEQLTTGIKSLAHQTLMSVREAREYSYEPAYLSPDIQDSASRAMHIASGFEGAILTVTRAYGLVKELDSRSAAKQASSALRESSGALRGLPQIGDDISTALKRDIEEVLTLSSANISDFSNSLLWHETPEWYVESVHKLIGVTGDLPGSDEQSREWEIIEFGVRFLKEQAGIVDPVAPVKPQISSTGSRRQLPEATSHEDHLNRQPLINALASILAHEANCEHQTIGLLGDWGIGKSTWLTLLKKELLKEHQSQSYLFGEFNAWAYEHTDNLQAGIAQEVIKSLSSPAPRLEDFDSVLANQNKGSWVARFMRWLGWKWDRAILTAKFAVLLNGGELLKLVFLLMLALCPLVLSIPELLSDYLASKGTEQTQALYRGAGVVGNTLWFLGFGVYFVKELPKLFANPLAKEMLTYLRLPDYAKHLGAVPVMRKNIETLCKIRLKSNSEKPSRLLFVVDDLDRCGHDGIVKVFEAVRLVLDIKNVTVIIAVDQHIALAALALHYEEVAKHHKLKDPRAIARDYLAKVIHLPIILANPMGADIESYLQKLWFSSASKEDHEIVEREQLDYVQQLTAEQQKIKSDKEKLASSSKGNTDMQSGYDLGAGTGGGVVSESVSSPVDFNEPAEVASLSAAQRRAFIYWLNYFGLTNPRQVKRLNNTYNLLLNCYRDVDKLPVATDLPDPMPKALFSMMMALITMEYLNSMDDQVVRNQLRSRLFLRSTGGEDIVPNAAPLTNEFISAFHLLLSERNELVEKVRPFVLPAIEKC